METIMSKCYPNWLHGLFFMNAKVEKVHSFFIYPSIETMGMLANFIYSLNCWVKTLLLIVTHNFVYILVSKGLVMALGACAFIVNVNMDYYKFKLAFRSSTT
jgi:hypothetical protein